VRGGNFKELNMKNGLIEAGDKIVTKMNLGIEGKHTPAGSTLTVGQDLPLDDARIMIHNGRATTDLKYKPEEGKKAETKKTADKDK